MKLLRYYFNLRKNTEILCNEEERKIIFIGSEEKERRR